MNSSSSYLPSVICRLRGLFVTPITSSIRQYAAPKSHPFYHPNRLTEPRPTKYIWKSKHYDPKFKAERGRKVLKMDLPNFHEARAEDMTPGERRDKLKSLGIQPMRRWTERSINLASSSSTMEAYVPPEGDGKAAFMSSDGVKQSYKFLNKKGKTFLAIRKVKKYEEEFDLTNFTEEATKIYIDLHNALAEYETERLHDLATERIYPMVLKDAENKQIRWSYLGALEAPRVVQARIVPLITDDNVFGQFTVRFHSQQLLAVYDRFGRLMHGSDAVAKDVLEYVVFEKHLANMYGVWRIHDKIVPDWMKLRPASFITFKKEEEPVEVEDDEKENVAEQKS